MMTTLAFFLVIFHPSAFASETSDSIAQKVIGIQSKIEQMDQGRFCKNNCIFVTFWDFDGTIQKGDCSEGLLKNDRVIYSGLAQKAIQAGLSKKFSTHEFDRFWTEYKKIETQSHPEAYRFLTRAFAGTQQSDLIRLAETTFKREYKNFFFKESVQILQELKKRKIEVYVISASPQFFVQGSSITEITSMDHIHGIRPKLDHGKVTDTLIPPITYGHGKVEKIKSIISERKQRQKDQKIFILAGFGNSYSTDGAFLEYIQSLPLPVGKPLSVMINGSGEPGKLKEKFMNVQFKEAIMPMDDSN